MAAAIGALVMLPWIGYLALSLPLAESGGAWRVAWVGFDVMLALVLMTTAWLGFRHRQVAILGLLVSSTMLFTDAWFDVALSYGTGEQWGAILSAAVLEIPFAILRYISFLSYPRFTLQGLAINEMRDDVYKPQGCLSASMLGATKSEIDALVSNDTQAEQGRMGGTKCTLVADGGGTMDYWDFKVSDFCFLCFT